MSKIAYIGISKDKTFEMFFRPKADMYIEDGQIHFCYLDAEGKDEEYHQEEFYTDFIVKSPKEVLKVLSAYDMYRLDITTDRPIKDAEPALQKNLNRVINRRFKRLQEEIDRGVMNSIDLYEERKDDQREEELEDAAYRLEEYDS